MKKEEKTLSDGIVESENVKNTLYLNNIEIITKKDVMDFVKTLKRKIKINGNLHTECCEECSKITRTDRHEDMIFEIMGDCLGAKFK